MKLVLKAYSQDVNFIDPSKSQYYLTFEDEGSGSEIRIPVEENTIVALVQKTAGGSAKRSVTSAPKEPEMPSQDDDLSGPEGSAEFEGATVFGDPGGEPIEEPDLEEDEEEETMMTAPDSEESIPSL